MELENLVIGLPKALALRAAGVDAPACFGYYRWHGHATLRQTAARSRSLTAYAYTAAELLELLPGGLTVDKNTYAAAIGEWVKLNGQQLNYPLAHLHLIKTPGGDFITGYFHDSKNIAFSKNSKDKINNLLSSEDNPAESLAGMVLELIREGRLLFSIK